MVKCFSCSGNLKEWKQDDNPLESHKEFYPECPYLKELEDKNKVFDTKVRLEDLSIVTEVCADRLKHLQSVQNKTKCAPGRLAMHHGNPETAHVMIIPKSIESIIKGNMAAKFSFSYLRYTL